MTHEMKALEAVVRRNLQGARLQMEDTPAPRPKRPQDRSRRARARVAELELSGLTEAEAIIQAGRELKLLPYQVRRALPRSDPKGGPGRPSNASRGRANTKQWTSEVAAWLAALAKLPGMPDDAADALSMAARGAARGDIEAGVEPWGRTALGLAPHKPFPSKKDLRSKRSGSR